MEEDVQKAITRAAILIRIKRLLADIAGLTPRDIKADQELAKNPLNYTPPAKLGLARPLNEAFGDLELTVKPIHTAACETVRDLRTLVEADLTLKGVEVIGMKIFGNPDEP
jgi:hypothetical protein